MKSFVNGRASAKNFVYKLDAYGSGQSELDSIVVLSWLVMLSIALVKVYIA